MRHCGALGVGLLTWLLVGCTAGRPVNPAAWLAHRPPPAPAAAPKEAVFLEIALLDCPVGNRFINDDKEGLWSQADEQIVTPEQKTVLEENGLRVGQISGLIPDELQMLLTSKRSNVNPTRRHLGTGYSVPLLTGPVQPEVQYTVQQDGEPVRLDKAQCKLLVVPSFTSDGKVKLRFTPQVEYGEKIPDYSPATERSGVMGWVRKVDRPNKTYADLSWETAVAPNQYIVIGARLEQRQSLGFASFVQTDPSNPVQRLLVIRAGRLGGQPADAEADALPEEAVSPGRPPVLAAQAQSPWTAVRASGP
jgi:hypothetical protein